MNTFSGGRRPFRINSGASLVSLVWLFAIAGSTLAERAATELTTNLLGGLPRKNPRPIEKTDGVDTLYDSFPTAGGYRVRTIKTVPKNGAGRLPAVLFVQWLSCDSVEIDPHDTSGWSGVLSGLIQTPGLIVMRTEKPGVADSEGPVCGALDYDTELSVHREALHRLLGDPAVDPSRVFIVGMSMGSNMAPLLAAGRSVAGIAIWGGGAKTWFERQLGFERQAMELSDLDPREYHDRMSRTAQFYSKYLIEGRAPAEIEKDNPSLKGLWGKWLVGTEGNTHYGRPLAFHQQAQRKNWAAAWNEISCPVLVLHGEFDWYEDVASAQLVVDLVNRRAPNAARLEIIPKTDHHLVRYDSRRAAFRGKNGVSNSTPAVASLRLFISNTLAGLTRPKQ